MIRASEFALRTAYAELAVRGNIGTRSMSEVLEELQQLDRLASSGSAIAQRMMDARMTWLEGESLLDSGKEILAIRLLARALRLSVRDGDPFSGFWMDDLERYSPAIRIAMPTCRGDALLVEARRQMQMKNLDQASS